MKISNNELSMLIGKWLLNHDKKNSIPNCRLVIVKKNLMTSSGEQPDVFGLNYHQNVLISVKTQRGAFNNDGRKKARKYPELGVGSLRLYCCPEGLIHPFEVPDKWGLIYYHADGKFRIVVKPKFQQSSIRDEMNICYSAALAKKDDPKILRYYK